MARFRLKVPSLTEVGMQGSRGRGLRAALLLVGPAGSGRTTAATAAAAALGLHLIPFNCHDLTSAAGLT